MSERERESESESQRAREPEILRSQRCRELQSQRDRETERQRFKASESQRDRERPTCFLRAAVAAPGRVLHKGVARHVPAQQSIRANSKP